MVGTNRRRGRRQGHAAACVLCETMTAGGGTSAVLDPEEALDESIERADQIAVWSTLSEYLHKKAINVLKSDVIPYDPTHGLILCSEHGYTDGLVLWQRLGMYKMPHPSLGSLFLVDMDVLYSISHEPEVYQCPTRYEFPAFRDNWTK